MRITTPRTPVPRPGTDPKAAPGLPWWRQMQRRDWIVLVFVEGIALSLLVTGISRGDAFAVVAGLVLALVYAPLRAGGWKLIRPWLSRPKPDRRDEQFYRRRK